MKKLLLILVVLLFASPVWAVDHYVNCEDAGSAENGTFAEPFNTVTQVNSHAMATGDDLYFAENTTCSGANLDNNGLYVDWTGTSGDRVIIGCYDGDGDFDCGNVTQGSSSDQKPILDGERTRPSASYRGLITIPNDSYNYVTIQDIAVLNSNWDGIRVDDSDYALIDNVYSYRADVVGINTLYTNNSTISDCVVDEGGYSQAAPYACINLGASGSTTKTHSNTVTRNKVSNCWREGIDIIQGAHSNIITYNVVWDFEGPGIYMDASYGNTVAYNLVYSTGNGLTGDGRSNKGISLLIENGTCNSYPQFGTGGPWNKTNEIYGNLVAGMNNEGIEMYGSSNANCDDMDNNLVYNNTVVDCGINYDTTADADYSGNEFKNNISANYYEGANEISTCAATGTTFANNLWHSDPGTGACDDVSDPVNGDPKLSQTADWRTLAAGLVTGTEFIANSNNSPALGSGTELGLSLPVAGNIDFTASPISVTTRATATTGKPAAPSWTAPTGAGASINPNCTSGAFAQAGVVHIGALQVDADTHTVSQWQIATTASGPNWASPKFDSGDDTSNLESRDVFAVTLDQSTEHKGRVRHGITMPDSSYYYSPWSSLGTFTTTGEPPTPEEPIHTGTWTGNLYY